MPLYLKKDQVKEVPFHQGTIQYQLGSIFDESGTKRYRYTRSMNLIRARYRITLQDQSDENHTPYVFDVTKSEITGQLDIRPDNDASRELWLSPKNSKQEALRQALLTIYQEDIEKT